eukprot:6227239-Alexandrium_andersonii.AAC.1
MTTPRPPALRRSWVGFLGQRARARHLAARWRALLLAGSVAWAGGRGTGSSHCGSGQLGLRA